MGVAVIYLSSAGRRFEDTKALGRTYPNPEKEQP